MIVHFHDQGDSSRRVSWDEGELHMTAEIQVGGSFVSAFQVVPHQWLDGRPSVGAPMIVQARQAADSILSGSEKGRWEEDLNTLILS